MGFISIQLEKLWFNAECWLDQYLLTTCDFCSELYFKLSLPCLYSNGALYNDMHVTYNNTNTNLKGKGHPYFYWTPLFHHLIRHTNLDFCIVLFPPSSIIVRMSVCIKNIAALPPTTSWQAADSQVINLWQVLQLWWPKHHHTFQLRTFLARKEWNTATVTRIFHINYFRILRCSYLVYCH